MGKSFKKLSVFSILILLVCSALLSRCAKKRKVLETYYFPEQMINIEQLTSQMNLLASMPDDLPVVQQLSILFTIERHLELLQVFDRYYNDLNQSLLDILKKYQSFLEGSFFKLQIALLERRYGDPKLARKYLENFKNDVLTPHKFRNFSGDLLNAFDSDGNLQPVLKKYMNDKEINELVYVVLNTFQKNNRRLNISSTFSKSDYLKFISTLENHQFKEAIKIALRSAYFSSPLYQERVNVKETNRQIDKPFYDVDYYGHLLKLMQGLYERNTAQFLKNDINSFIANLDSTKLERLFYYLLQITDGFYFTPSSNFLQFEKILSALARTDFQKALLSIQTKAIRSHSNVPSDGKIDIPSLPDSYHPFMQTILQAFAIKQYTKAGMKIDIGKIEACKEDIYKNAIQDIYREKLLSYLGEGLLGSERWKEASIYLNYNVRSGYAMSQNDALILSKLAYAYFKEKNQLSLSVWILKELSSALPYAKILHLYNQFYLQAHYFKVSREKIKGNKGDK